MTDNELAALLAKPVTELTREELDAAPVHALKAAADAALDRACNASPDARRFAEQVRALAATTSREPSFIGTSPRPMVAPPGASPARLRPRLHGSARTAFAITQPRA